MMTDVTSVAPVTFSEAAVTCLQALAVRQRQ